MREPWSLATAGAAAALLCASALPHRPAILYNATASAPLGLWRLAPVATPSVGDWVVYRPPGRLGRWIAGAGYAPAGVPLLKRVAAVGGARVCREGAQVRLDGEPAAVALPRDRRGRALPAWSGCATLGHRQVFLLNDTPGSLDGRYFGPSRVADLVAAAEPLWTWRGR